MDKEKFIRERLELHKKELLKHYRWEQVLGIFVYGSFNYGTATELSDVDTKAILIPTFANLVFNKPVSVQIDLPNNEHCEVKDIREMVDMFKKQNINFIEILYTDYFILNPFYEELWNEYFIKYREDIAHFDRNKTIQSICGQAIHTLKQDPTDGKKVSNAYRLYYFLSDYLNGRPYHQCIQQEGEFLNTMLRFKNQKKVKEGNAECLITAFEQIRELKAAPDPYNSAETAMKLGMLRLIRLLDSEVKDNVDNFFN